MRKAPTKNVTARLLALLGFLVLASAFSNRAMALTIKKTLKITANGVTTKIPFSDSQRMKDALNSYTAESLAWVPIADSFTDYFLNDSVGYPLYDELAIEVWQTGPAWELSLYLSNFRDNFGKLATYSVRYQSLVATKLAERDDATFGGAVESIKTEARKTYEVKRRIFEE